MAHGDFIWCDLSAHNAAASRDFYAQVFGWAFVDNGDYHIAHTPPQTPVAGHYQMPQKFIDIKMPAFWMSYIAVDDVETTATRAKELGAKVELGPAEFAGGGTYALIRDPLGAGFTVYNGPQLGQISNTAGARMGHGLFVSNAAAVIEFYESLFGWKFSAPDNGVYTSQTASGYRFHLHEVPDPNIRGKEEFWAVYFATPSLKDCATQVQAGGGELVANMPLPEGNAALMRDPDKGAFVVLEGANAQKAPQNPRTQKPFLWKAWVGLGLSIALVFTPLIWPWAIFFAAWLIQGLKSRETYLFERVARNHDPLLYWILMAFYAIIAILCLPIWGYPP